jgi:hypothetical protein
MQSNLLSRGMGRWTFLSNDARREESMDGWMGMDTPKSPGIDRPGGDG